MLLDNEENTTRFSPIRLNRIFSMMTIIGLFYGCFLFFNYWMISKEVSHSSPYLPKYTASYIYGLQAFKGMILLAGIALSQIAKLFHLRLALILLIISFTVAFNSDLIYLRYQ